MAVIYIDEPKLRGLIKVAPLRSSANDNRVMSPENLVPSDFVRDPIDIVDLCGINPSEIEFAVNTQSSEEGSYRTSGLDMHKDILGRVRTINLNWDLLKKEQYQQLSDFFMDMVDNSDFSNKVSVYSVDGSTEAKSFTGSFTLINIYAKLKNETTGWTGEISTSVSSTQNISLNTYYNANGSVPSGNDIVALNVTIAGNTVTLTPINGFKYTILEADITSQSKVLQSNVKLIVWYYIEIMLPESDYPVKEVVYVGDSGFTNLGTIYKTKLEYVDNVGTKEIKEIYTKGLKLPLIAKTKKIPRRFRYGEPAKPTE